MVDVIAISLTQCRGCSKNFILFLSGVVVTSSFIRRSSLDSLRIDMDASGPWSSICCYAAFFKSVHRFVQLLNNSLARVRSSVSLWEAFGGLQLRLYLRTCSSKREASSRGYCSKATWLVTFSQVHTSPIPCERCISQAGSRRKPNCR